MQGVLICPCLEDIDHKVFVLNIRYNTNHQIIKEGPKTTFYYRHLFSGTHFSNLVHQELVVNLPTFERPYWYVRNKTIIILIVFAL